MLTIGMAKLRKMGIVRNQSGFTLIEAVIGIALLSIVVVAVLTGVSTSFSANAVADRQSTAMSVATDQVESLQQQIYQVAPSGGEVTYTKIVSIPGNLSIWSYNRAGAVVSDIVGVPWSSSIIGSDGNATVDDNGLQKIKVVIKQGGKVVLTLETYKVQ